MKTAGREGDRTHEMSRIAQEMADLARELSCDLARAMFTCIAEWAEMKHEAACRR